MIQVLCVELSGANEDIFRRFYQQASPERRARADRFRRREDALRCVAAEALLRYALGADCRMEPGPSGKPFLPDRPEIHFNLSHSGNWAVIAWGASEVGVDVESSHGRTNITGVAQRFFTLEEQAYIFQDDQMQHQRFLEVWTSKESYVKYLGTGIQMDLRSFSVLSLEGGLFLHRKTLPDGSLLCLCTAEDTCQIDFIDVHSLIP